MERINAELNTVAPQTAEAEVDNGGKAEKKNAYGNSTMRIHFLKHTKVLRRSLQGAVSDSRL